MHREIVYQLTRSHRLMERLLSLVKAQIVMLQPGDGYEDERFSFLKNALGYMRNYPGLIHHPAEEILFERLMPYAPDTRVLCERLSMQHKNFTELESSLFRYIDLAQTGNIKAHGHIARIGTVYCTEHVNHISDEEDKVFPRAAKYLQPGDWAEIREFSLRATDPLVGRDTLERYENLYDYLIVVGEKLTRD